jgi:hypothetical protein
MDPKTNEKHIRYAPSFISGTVLRAGTEHAYTEQPLARFLGMVQADGDPQEKFRVAFGALPSPAPRTRRDPSCGHFLARMAAYPHWVRSYPLRVRLRSAMKGKAATFSSGFAIKPGPGTQPPGSPQRRDMRSTISRMRGTYCRVWFSISCILKLRAEVATHLSFLRSERCGASSPI